MTNPSSVSKCSAELHSAVSQIFDLRFVRKLGEVGNAARLAECNSAIRQITNLRYVADADPRQALLQCPSSAVAQNRAFTGLFIT